jgi:hypothetical protein
MDEANMDLFWGHCRSDGQLNQMQTGGPIAGGNFK